MDDRRVLSGIIYVIRNGLQWKDAPKVYGPLRPLWSSTADGMSGRNEYIAAELAARLPHSAHQDEDMLTVKTFDHIVLNVADVEASADWYERVLGMDRETHLPPSGGVARISMMFGRHKINLRPIAASQDEWFTGVAPQPGSDDLCLLTDTPPEAVADHFRACGVPIELGPTTKKGAMGRIRSVYVRDPDGNLVEIASYF